MRQIIRRRRGGLLEGKIFIATLDILEKEGYGSMSFSRVAELAHTSRSVIYRRWNAPFDLLCDAMNYRANAKDGRSLDSFTFNEGNLRDNLVKMLSLFIKRFANFDADFTKILLSEYGSGNKRLRKLKDSVTQVDINAMNKILKLAIDNGEIDKLPPRQIILLPFEYIRYHFVIGEKIKESTIKKLVNDIILPLIIRQKSYGAHEKT